MISALRERITRDKLNDFYSGKIYPLIIAFLITVGSVFKIEMLTYVLHTILLVGAFAVCKTVKPILISLLAYVMQRLFLTGLRLKLSLLTNLVVLL